MYAVFGAHCHTRCRTGLTEQSDDGAGQVEANRSGASLSGLKETLRVAKIAKPRTVPAERGAMVSAHTTISTSGEATFNTYNVMAFGRDLSGAIVKDRCHLLG